MMGNSLQVSNAFKLFISLLWCCYVHGWISRSEGHNVKYGYLESSSSTRLPSTNTDNNNNNSNSNNAVQDEILRILPRFGLSDSILNGEKAEAKRRRRQSKHFSKSNARVRLFCLYGVADSSTSMRKWVTSAPDWLEVRVVELPGHGYLSEGLPPCSYRCVNPLTNQELEIQRSEWVKCLADEIEPLIRNQQHASVPYAFYGFSFGAMISYLLCLELDKRGVPPPLALFACGRGGPNVIPHSNQLLQNLQLWDDVEMLQYVESKLGIPTSDMPPSRRERMSALFRCGMIFSCLHVGKDQEEENVACFDSADLCWDDIPDSPVAIATNLPSLNCAVISLTGSLDTTWPPKLVERWFDTITQNQTQYRHICLDGITHPQLMNAHGTRDIVFDEMARLALGRGLSS